MNLIDLIIPAVEHWLEQLRTTEHQSDNHAASMAFMELSAQALGQRIAQLALSRLLQDSGTGYDCSTRPCPCGDKQRFQRYAHKAVRTLVGEVSYTRAYYRCRSCRASSFPLDEKINQSSREISPGLQRAVALLSAHLSFIEAERVLEQVTGAKLSARQIETVAESIGAEAEQLQKQEEELVSRQGLVEMSGPNQPAPRTFIVEMDGVQVGLQDGSWQEAKCGVVYELSQRVEMNPGRWELLKRHRCVLRGDVARFRKRLWELGIRAGIREQDRVVVIGDGAEWIDQTAGLLYPRSIRILDYYHASERVWAVANLRWSEGSPQASRWAEKRLSKLRDGGIADVISSMRKLKIRGEEAQKIRAAAIRYMKGRQAQMKYGQYREAGLPIGSGAVESSCKQLVSARCKQAGMRWSEAGVDAILALRSLVLNERLNEVCPKPEISIDWAKAA